MIRKLISAMRRSLTQAPLRGVADAQLEHVSFAIGSLQAREARRASSIAEAEFRCYSQFGEDGIIQWLIARVPVENETFVELGVGDYRESNTRFLLEHDDWRGLIIDSGDAHLRYLANNPIQWRHSITGRQAFITRENVNDLVGSMAVDLGLLSIDVDGMDYWIWEAVTAVSPRIVIVEYNSLFGSNRPVVVPYQAAFDRAAAHHSYLYWGASLPALAHLAEQKGYRLAGSNRTGHNAFFVREDVAAAIPVTTAREAWRESRYRESRAPDGSLTYVESHAERRAMITSMPLVDVVSGEQLTVRDLPSER